MAQQDRNFLVLPACSWGEHREKPRAPSPPNWPCSGKARGQSSVFYPSLCNNKEGAPVGRTLTSMCHLIAIGSAPPFRVFGQYSDFDSLPVMTGRCTLSTEPVYISLTYTLPLQLLRFDPPYMSQRVNKTLPSRLCHATKRLYPSIYQVLRDCGTQ